MAIQISTVIIYQIGNLFFAEGRNPEGERLPEDQSIKAPTIHSLARTAIDAGWEISAERVHYDTEEQPYNPRTKKYKDGAKPSDIERFDHWYFEYKRLCAK